MFGFSFGTPAAQQPAATASGSLFGGQQTATQTSSIFGATPAQPQQQSGQLFGSTPLFGQPPASQPATTSSGGLFGSFGAPTTAAGAFGTAAKPPAFSFGGAASTSATPSLFGAPATSVAPFGAVSSQPSGSTSLFGQPAPAVTSAPSTSGMALFGTGFGQAPSQPVSGTTVKFQPPQATDTAQKGSLSTTVTTKHMVITAMKEYESRSLEELRLEDYMANRRVAAPGTTTALSSGGLFGATPANANKPLFGSPAPTAQPNQPSLFGTTSTTAPASTGFTFGQQPAVSTGGSLFGTNNPAASTATAGAPFSFGAAQAKPTLSLPTTSAPSSGFSFGTPQPASQPQTTGLFGAKPVATSAPFGTTTTSTFGGAFGSLAQPTTTTAPTSLFGATSTAPAAGGLFAPKPATSAPFGFGSPGTTPSAFGQPTASQPSLFPTASAPTAGGSLFGTTASSAAPAGSSFSFGASPFGSQQASGTQSLMGGPNFGQSTASGAAQAFGSTAPVGGGLFQFPTAASSAVPTATAFGAPTFAGNLPSNVETAATAMMQALVHQKLLSLARCQPAYSVLFREPTSSSVDSSSSISRGIDHSSSTSSYTGRSGLPSTDGLGSLRTSLAVASSLPATTMTSRPHTAGNGLFDLKPRFGSGSGNASRLGLSWTGTQATSLVPGAARWSPSKIGSEPAAVSPRSVISPLSLAPRHSIRQLIPKRFSMTMDNSAADLNGTGDGSGDVSVNDNGRGQDMTMNNPSAVRGGGLTADHGLLGVDISVVRPDGADTSFVDRIPSTGRSSSSIPSSTPLNPRPMANIAPGATPRGRSDRHVPLIKIEEHQTPSPPGDVERVWQDDFADERPCSISPESRQRTSVQRKQFLIQQSRPVLQRPGYTSIPAISELVPSINENAEDSVEWFADDFQVSREGYGSVVFHGRVNLTGLNLDQIVHIERGEIIVYPDESTKPPVGQGLNRPSTLTLEGIFPEDKSTREPTRSFEALSHYKDYLREISGRLGAKFIDYRGDIGAWQIKVPHFTRYGLLPTDGAVVGDSTTNITLNQTSTAMKFDKVNTSAKFSRENTYTGQSPPLVSKLSSSGTPLQQLVTSKDVDMMENAGSANVQLFLERIERLQSKAEKSLSGNVVVQAELSKDHSLERHVKTDSSTSTAIHDSRLLAVKRARRIQWPHSIVELIPTSGFRSTGFGNKSFATSSSTVSLESVARKCYYMRGRRCSFVPCVGDAQLLYIVPSDNKGNNFVHTVSLRSHGQTTDASLCRFISRCLDILNGWSSDSLGNNANIFSTLFDSTNDYSDSMPVPFVIGARKIFSLCAALWSQKEGSNDSVMNELAKKSLLDWLGLHQTSTTVQTNGITPEMLFGRRTDALRSIVGAFPRLALILAQAGGNPSSLTLLCQQLEIWNAAGILRRFMAANSSPSHLLALAGNCQSLTLNPVPNDARPLSIQLFGSEPTHDKVSWRSALAAQLRYGPAALPTVPLADAIREFDTFQHDSPECYAPYAIPPTTGRGLDTAAYNLLLAYSKTDSESIANHFMRAIAAVQQSATDDTLADPTNINDWAISGNGDILAWLLLRAFYIAGCVPRPGIGTDADCLSSYNRISVVTAVKLAALSITRSSPSWNSVVSVMAESLQKTPSDVDKLLKFWTNYNRPIEKSTLACNRF